MGESTAGHNYYLFYEPKKRVSGWTHNLIDSNESWIDSWNIINFHSKWKPESASDLQRIPYPHSPGQDWIMYNIEHPFGQPIGALSSNAHVLRRKVAACALLITRAPMNSIYYRNNRVQTKSFHSSMLSLLFVPSFSIIRRKNNKSGSELGASFSGIGSDTGWYLTPLDIC